MLRGLNRLFFGLGLGVSLFAGIAAGNGDSAPEKPKRASQSVNIKITPWGPAQAEVEAAKMRVERSEAVQSFLRGTKYRLIGFEYVDNGDKSLPTSAPTRFRVIFYDYTNDRSIIAENDFAAGDAVTARVDSLVPFATNEEIQDAIRIIRNDARFAAALRNRTLRPSAPMPSYTIAGGERLINIMLDAQDAGAQNEIVGVSFRRHEVVRYEGGAPPTSAVATEACGIPDAGQGSTGPGVAGQYQLTVTQSGAPLWEMLVIRPSSSSGGSFERSGIEIRDVKYKGKSVLKRGHAPILNVQYFGNACGPYRDWQYAEGYFDAPADGATNPAPGIRILAPGKTAATALDSGSDTGNFQGVAIYTQDMGPGSEVVMVSEMDAGWYRYIMEWRFGYDGTIRPRYGFGATDSFCVCAVHTHHVYWRLDFDVVQPNNKIFQIERGRKFQQPITNELTRLRNYQTNRGFLIQNPAGNEAYSIFPNLSDGVADSYGRSDFWFLRYKTGAGGEVTEIDDPPPAQGDATAANLTPWLTDESLVEQDVVVWYAAHFIHADGQNLLNPDRSGLVLSGSHAPGPDIRPVRW